MVVFIDTSSLIKRYVEEQGSDEVDRYFSENTDIYISPVTPVEMYAALKRKLRDESISSETYRNALKLWQDDFNNYSVVLFNDELIAKALDIVNTHDVKTLDALQIGAALLSRAEESVTSDRQMHRVLDLISGVTAVYI
jgi:predicted nucleic acid-binding protein